MLTGAQAMVESLKKEETELIFGYPGAAIADFYDKLAGSGIRHVLTRTEQGAGHAASGYARISGKTGVCVATSGPGATNLLTAIATAYSDSIPLVAITGQVESSKLGRDVFQEVDTTGAAQPFTKYSYLVKSAADIPRVFKEAFHIASTGRRGPVLIDVPADVQAQRAEFKYPESVNIRGYRPSSAGHPLQVRRVAEAISASKRPLLCLGGGVFLSNAVEAVRGFCEGYGIPAVSTMMGLGIFPRSHPLYCGMLGQAGCKAAAAAVKESDLLLLIGVRVGDRTVGSPASLNNGATVVHIDIDPAEIGKNVGATIPLVGDAAKIIPQLMEQSISGDWLGWAQKLRNLREAGPPCAGGRHGREGFVDPNAFVRGLCERLPAGSVYVADVGQNQIWSARNFCGDLRFLTSGGMGTMGYSIPAAVGAKLAAPDKTVVAVCGDGAFQMSMNELATARQEGCDLKVVVMNNGTLGLIREIQKNSYGGRSFAVELSGGPDLKLISAAYGMKYLHAQSDEEAIEAAEEMLRENGTALLECAVDPKEVIS